MGTAIERAEDCVEGVMAMKSSAMKPGDVLTPVQHRARWEILNKIRKERLRNLPKDKNGNDAHAWHIDAVCRALNISRDTLGRHEADGKVSYTPLAHVRRTRKYVITRPDLESWVDHLVEADLATGASMSKWPIDQAEADYLAECYALERAEQERWQREAKRLYLEELERRRREMQRLVVIAVLDADLAELEKEHGAMDESYKLETRNRIIDEIFRAQDWDMLDKIYNRALQVPDKESDAGADPEWPKEMP